MAAKTRPSANKQADRTISVGCLVVFGCIVLYLAWAISLNNNAAPSDSAAIPQAAPSSFNIVAESEVKSLELAGILGDFTQETGIALTIEYKGPVDIKAAVEHLADDPTPDVDAYWPGSSLWLTGSTKVEPQSVMKTYVVLAIDPSVAQELGWNTRQGIAASDIIDGIRTGKIRLAMTSASQSTPGAAFYLAMYTALTGRRVLTSDTLSDPATIDSMQTMLAGVERSAESLDHLKDVFIEDQRSGAHRYNAIVIYESLAIQMNQSLITMGQPPMSVYYPDGATAIADVPIRYVDNGNGTKLAQYEQLVAFLTRPDIQQRIQAQGWRTNPIGMSLENADTTIFNPAWGIDTTTEFREMVFPKLPAALAALNQYQSSFRKPSYTVYCLDYSGSMRANGGREQMIDAMDLLLDQERAGSVLLQATERDQSVVYAFSDYSQLLSEVEGNDPVVLNMLSDTIATSNIQGGTALFSCVKDALKYVSNHFDPTYSYAIIAMTDGESNQGISAADFATFYQQMELNIPVFGIAFGSADFSQMSVFELTGGAVYDGREDIAAAFRRAKGNN